MSEIRKQMTEAYEKLENENKKKHKEKDEKVKEVDLDKASPFMLMRLGFQKLLEQDEKQNLDD